MKNKNQKDFEVVLAMGRVKNFNGEYWIGDRSPDFINQKIKELEGSNILLKVVIANE